MTRKELFIQNICKPIAEMTEQNDHTGAVVALCEYLNDITPEGGYCANLLEWALYIQEEHNRIGHLPGPLCAFRNIVMDDALMRIKFLLGEDYANELRSSL